MEHEILELIAEHRSVRDYRDAPLDPEVLAASVRAAQMASTSSHVQAYGVIHVSDPAKRARLVELTGGQKMVGRAGAFLIICGDIRRHRLLAERAGHAQVQNFESFLVAVVDASLFAQNLSLAFEARGLGMCYVGGLRNQLDVVDALLDLPEGVLPLYGLCVGEPADRPAKKPRLPLGAVLSENGYPDDARMLELLDGYDAQMADYYAQRRTTARDWSGGVLRKLEVGRREYLADYYRRKGARLD